MFPAWLEALVLGVVQGLTEFIPVSSSGHLVLVPYLAGWERHSLAFDVVMHVGTMGAVLVYMRAEIMAIAKGILRLDRSEQGRIYRRVGLFILPASVPVGLVGVLLEEQVEDAFGSPLVAALLLLATAGLLLAMEAFRARRALAPAMTAPAAGPEDAPLAGAAWQGDWRAEGTAPAATEVATPAVDLPLGEDPADPRGTSLAGLTLRQAMVAGLFQCVAILPGISRSGATISGGVFAGLTREAATRFSFLLVIPALVGATALSLPDLVAGGEESGLELVVGAGAAFLSGYLAIRYLVALVSRERLTGFAWYCVAAAAVGLVGYAMIGAPSSV